MEPLTHKSGVLESEVDVASPELSFPAERRDTVAKLGLIWDHRTFIGKATVAGLLLSILLAFILPRKYEATARLMPPDNKQSSGLAALAAVSSSSSSTSPAGIGGLVGDLLGTKTSSATFIGILQSRTVADQLIKEFELQKVYGSRYVEDARKRLKGRSSFTEDRKSGIITIVVTDRNPQRASAIAQAYITELDHLVAQLSTSSARREREFLESRLQVVKSDLEQAELELSRFSSKNSTLDLKEQSRAMLDAATRVQAELIAAQTEVEGLKQIYTESNVRVRAAQARVRELQNKLNQMGGQADGDKPPAATDSAANFEYPSIRQLPVLGVTYMDLYRKTRIAEIVYELLTRQYEMAKVEEAKEIPTVKELDFPVVPQKQSFPPFGLTILLGTMFAFAVGVTWVFAEQRWAEMGNADPKKQLAREIFSSTHHFLSKSRERWRVSKHNIASQPGNQQ